MKEPTPDQPTQTQNFVEKMGLRIYEVDSMHIMEFLEAIPEGYRVATLDECGEIPVPTPLVAFDRRLIPKNPPFQHDLRLEDEAHIYIWGHSMASTKGVFGDPVSNSSLEGKVNIALKAI